MLYRVSYKSQRIIVNDPMYGLLLDKEVRFPTFESAVVFARSVSNANNGIERTVGKALVEEVAESA